MESKMNKKGKVGIILPDLSKIKAYHQLISRSKSSEDYEITHVFTLRSARTASVRFKSIIKFIRECTLMQGIEKLIFKILFRCETFLLRPITYKKSSSRDLDLSDLGIALVELQPMLSSEHFSDALLTADLELIKKFNFDLLISEVPEPINVQIINSIPLSIITLHYGTEIGNSIGPPGFFEVLNREPRTMFAVRRLISEKAEKIIFKGNISTTFCCTLNSLKLDQVSKSALHDVIKKIFTCPASLNHETSYYLSGEPAIPIIKDQFRYLLLTVRLIIVKIYRALTGKRYIWGVAYKFVSDWQSSPVGEGLYKIENPKGRFLADPFLIKKNGSHYCFVEDYSILRGKASISVYKLTTDGYSELGVALEEPFHLSYPFLIEHDDKIYMVPEVHESGEIRLYQSIDFPLKWKLCQVLMTGVCAADTNIFFNGGKWWLLTNLSSVGKDGHGHELHIFSSDKLISNKWYPHPQNPVLFDSFGGRNGGQIIEPDAIYRVYQCQGFDMYGETLGVSRINKITENEFSEMPFITVEPTFFEGLKGTHSLSYAAGALAVDYVSIE